MSPRNFASASFSGTSNGKTASFVMGARLARDAHCVNTSANGTMIITLATMAIVRRKDTRCRGACKELVTPSRLDGVFQVMSFRALASELADRARWRGSFIKHV